MIKELKYLFFLIMIFFFIFFTARYYFSDENIKKSYRSLSSIDEKINNIEKDLMLLENDTQNIICLLYTSPSPRDLSTSRMPSSA